MVNFLEAITRPLALTGSKSSKSSNEGDLIWVCPNDYRERSHAFHLPARDKHNQFLSHETVESKTIHLFHPKASDSAHDAVAENLAATCYCDGTIIGGGIGQCRANGDHALNVMFVFPDPKDYADSCMYFWGQWGR